MASKKQWRGVLKYSLYGNFDKLKLRLLQNQKNVGNLAKLMLVFKICSFCSSNTKIPIWQVAGAWSWSVLPTRQTPGVAPAVQGQKFVLFWIFKKVEVKVEKHI